MSKSMQGMPYAGGGRRAHNIQINVWHAAQVVAGVHNPWVTTDTSFKEFEQMRVAMEPVLYQFGVDVMFNGHVHSYERTNPVYNYALNPCGMVHIVVGDAGNSEGPSGLNYYTDTLDHCARPRVLCLENTTQWASTVTPAPWTPVRAPGSSDLCETFLCFCIQCSCRGGRQGMTSWAPARLVSPSVLHCALLGRL